MIEYLEFLDANSPRITRDLVQHLYLSVFPVIIGLVVAVPLGMLAVRSRWMNTPLLGLSSVAYSIPSLALFIVAPTVLGTQILDPLNVVSALALYTAALLFRNVTDGLRSVPEPVTMAATALGMRRFRQLLTVELPIAVPVIAAGLRVATVSNISMVSVGAVLGVGGLGDLFTYGFQISSLQMIGTGIVLSVLLALVADLLIVLVQRLTTPWARARAAR